MTTKRFNWPLWVGFVLTLAAFMTYFSVFIRFPATRDFPWANLPIFLLAIVFLVLGVRRGFAAGRPHPTRSKIITSIIATLSVLVIAFFVFTVFIAARWLPPSKGAPQVGQQAPDFTLTDTTGKQVSLTELRTAPIDGKAPKGVLLVFYRGYL
jgi:hypothetical protein